MRKLVALAIILIAALTWSCVTLSEEEKSGVHMTRNPAQTLGCKSLGTVTTSWQLNRKRSEYALIRKAAELGANTLFLGYQEKTFTARMDGEAYLCPK